MFGASRDSYSPKGPDWAVDGVEKQTHIASVSPTIKALKVNICLIAFMIPSYPDDKHP